MAERRMFSKAIIDSDAFLDMPISSQNLYFHLSMRADDDGFVSNHKKICRMVGAADDDIKVLLTKRFILGFESGLIVIKHWRINNYLRGDRYKSTVYTEEMKLLSIKENGAYTINSGIPLVDQRYTTGIPKEDTRYTTGRRSIGKDSIDKDSIDKSTKSARSTKKADTKDQDEAHASTPTDISIPVSLRSEDQDLYKAIWDSFLAKTPAFTNYPKESKATHKIIEYCKQHDKDNPISFAKNMLEIYYNLTTSGAKFWREQPFTPSRLASPGIFDMVAKEVRGFQDINQSDIPDIPF